jgi:hypothetical protein
MLTPGMTDRRAAPQLELAEPMGLLCEGWTKVEGAVSLGIIGAASRRSRAGIYSVP